MQVRSVASSPLLLCDEGQASMFIQNQAPEPGAYLTDETVYRAQGSWMSV